MHSDRVVAPSLRWRDSADSLVVGFVNSCCLQQVRVLEIEAIDDSVVISVWKQNLLFDVVVVFAVVDSPYRPQKYRSVSDVQVAAAGRR